MSSELFLPRKTTVTLGSGRDKRRLETTRNKEISRRAFSESKDAGGFHSDSCQRAAARRVSRGFIKGAHTQK